MKHTATVQATFTVELGVTDDDLVTRFKGLGEKQGRDMMAEMVAYAVGMCLTKGADWLSDGDSTVTISLTGQGLEVGIKNLAEVTE